MRSNEELEACIEANLFDLVIGVYDPRKELESEDSFNINIWEKSHYILPNAGTKQDLFTKLMKVYRTL